MRKVTLTPSSFDRYATNGVQRSVTPEAFSAGTTANVSSGYFAFQSSAEADAVNANAAAPARTMRRVIMLNPLVVVTLSLAGCRFCKQPACGLSGAQAAAISPRAGTVEAVGTSTGAFPMTSLASRS